MTSLSRRKRRITARAITRATLAASAAAALALFVAPLSAQPPGGLPLPKGYQPRTPPTKAQPQPARPAVAPTGGPLPGSAGQIMYFNKPADVALANGANGQPIQLAEGVAHNDTPLRAADVPVPDVPPQPLPPPASRYLPPQGGIAPPPAVTVSLPQPTFAQPLALPAAQPGDTTSTSKKAIPTVPAEYVQLPARESVFMVYDDKQLDRAILDRVIRDRITTLEKQIQSEPDATKLPQLREQLEKAKKALQEPSSDPSYQFPALPVVSPPGVAYRPKTLDYSPRQVLIEPSYVVHRRLHFEDKNAERSGWDLGPIQALVSTGYFWRDTLLWPQSLASACVRGPWDTNAGKAGVGCPSPYYLYPLGLTVTGTAAETAIITGGAFLLP